MTAERKQALLDAAKAVCSRCADGREPVRSRTGYVHGASFFCDASAIHELIHREEAAT